MTCMTHTQGRARPQPRLNSLRNLFALSRQRRALAHLDESRLNDIGITRDDALKEARRPVWDVPQSWIA